MALSSGTKKFLNFAAGFLSFNWRIPVNWNGPVVHAIETTNLCNARCIMCPRNSMKRSIGEMGMDLFKKIIDECAPYTASISLSHYGDPLCDSKIIERINYCSGKGIITTLSTNAIALSSELSERLLLTQLDRIVFAIDGATREVYESIRIGGNFKKVTENVKNFIEKKNSSGKSAPKITIQFVQMKKNESQIDDFKKQWNIPGVDEVLIKNFETRADPSIQSLSSPEHRHGFGKRERFPCVYLWQGVIILWDGRVVPCATDCNATLVLGDLKKQSLQEVWKGGPLKRLKQQHIRGNYSNDLCRNCEDFPHINPTRLMVNKKYLKRFKYIKTLFGKSRGAKNG